MALALRGASVSVGDAFPSGSVVVSGLTIQAGDTIVATLHSGGTTSNLAVITSITGNGSFAAADGQTSAAGFSRTDQWICDRGGVSGSSITINFSGAPASVVASVDVISGATGIGATSKATGNASSAPVTVNMTDAAGWLVGGAATDVGGSATWSMTSPNVQDSQNGTSTSPVDTAGNIGHNPASTTGNLTLTSTQTLAGNWTAVATEIKGTATTKPLVGLLGSKRLPGMRGPRDNQGFIKRGVYDYTIPVATALNITGDIGSIVLTGFAPSIGFGITGVDGSIVLTGFAPSAAFNLNLTGSTGSIVLAGFAPSIGFGLTGDTGSITLSGFAPSIGFGLTGNTGSIVLTGFAPTLSQAFNLTANVGSIVLSGFAPDVGLSGGGALNITGATGTILLTGFAPSIAFGLMANVGSIVLTGFAPTLAQTFALTAGTGAIVLEGFAPTLDGVLFTPPVGGSGGKEIRGGLLYWLKLLQELEAQGTPEPEDEQQHEQFIAKRERLRAKVKKAQRAEAARKAAEMAAEQEDEERILMLFLQYLSGNYGS